MTASDCYNLALMLYKQDSLSNLYSHAAEWFETALEKLNNEQDENTFTSIEVMTYIVKSHHHSNFSTGLFVKSRNINEVFSSLTKSLKIYLFFEYHDTSLLP